MHAREAPLSGQMEAWLISSSDDVTLSSSSVVSSTRLLFWEKRSFSRPLVVTHKRALLLELGWQGPKAGVVVFSYLYSFCIHTAGPHMA
jgi:hypothetical protein